MAIIRILLALLLIVCFGVVFMIMDVKNATYQKSKGVIVWKQYSPSSSSVGTGWGYGSRGGGPVITSSHSPEQFIFFVENKHGQRIITNTSRSAFDYKNEGDSVTISVKIGAYTGMKIRTRSY